MRKDMFEDGTLWAILGLVVLIIIIGVCWIKGANHFKNSYEGMKETYEAYERQMQEQIKIRQQAEEMIAEGAPIYLDGIKVDIKTINLDVYYIQIRDEKIILWD